MLEKITSGNGTLEDLDKMEELCYYIKDNALCGLGQTAPTRYYQHYVISGTNILLMSLIRNVLPAYVKLFFPMLSILRLAADVLYVQEFVRAALSRAR
jgi:hypothetical protein